MGNLRSSIRQFYPRMRIEEGFSNQKLMTSSERVDWILILALSLQNKDIQGIFEKAHKRQKKKYLTFPSQTSEELEEDCEEKTWRNQ